VYLDETEDGFGLRTAAQAVASPRAAAFPTILTSGFRTSSSRFFACPEGACRLWPAKLAIGD
jgi:hypothetical protein